MQSTPILQERIDENTSSLKSLTARFESVIADPDPLGVFGFAFATFLANLSTLGVYSFNAMWLSTGMV
jgi:succinate-acetate transporter protein